MAFDWYAVSSYGAFPTPTPTGTQRAAYGVSYGLLNTIPEYTETATKVVGIIKKYAKFIFMRRVVV
jgi:hypothetical protein